MKNVQELPQTLIKSYQWHHKEEQTNHDSIQAGNQQKMQPVRFSQRGYSSRKHAYIILTPLNPIFIY